MRALLLALLALAAIDAGAQTHYVATVGADVPGAGTDANEWATIAYALDQVADGATILVKPGTYHGRIRIDRAFANGITIRSQLPYQARLRHDATVLTIFSDASDVEGITIEGFDIAHTAPAVGGLLIQVQDGAATETRRIVLRDNVIHDSHDNDLLKVNNGATDVRVAGNMFYNQFGSDEHIDVNSVEDVVIEDNVFFNDYAASGRAIPIDGLGNVVPSSQIVVKDSNGGDDEFTGSRRITIRRNVFLNWQGSPGSNFVLFGEDGMPFHETDGALVENNLFLGNSPLGIRAALGIKGSRDIDFRANTVVGDLPGNAFAMRLNIEGDNLAPTGIRFHDNIWSDPTGTMGAGGGSANNDFSDTPPSEVGTVEIDGNVYWNGGVAVPDDAAEAVNPSDDANARFGDPQLASNAAAATPYWMPAASTFNGGHATIRAAFVDLVARYGTPAAGGAGIGLADASRVPPDDILGRPRGAPPFDVGALELDAGGPADVLFRDGFESP